MKKSLLIAIIFFTFLFAGRVHAQNTYIVLTTVSSSDPYYQAAQTLATYRNAQIIHFNADSINALIPVLQNIQPRYVAVVLKPIELNINFVRQFLMMSTRIDADPFSDFSYGYITGATAQDALNFVNNIIYAESQNIQNYPLNVGGYAASSINAVYSSPGDYLTYLNPPDYSQIYMETNDSGTGLNYFLSNTNSMLNKKLLDIGYNGDPHMLWLFDGGNTNPNPPVWNYDSTKIEDTAYSRVGLTSFNIGALNLYPAVAFNGACHSGEPKRVMVESDIAATFGDPQGVIKFYTMSDSFSFALSILKTGITGYFAPCGANNANDEGEEVYNAFLYHEPLGDIFKRSIDGVVMGFLGNSPELRIFQEGGSEYDDDIYSSGTFNPADWSGASAMLGGKANRIYFGDPLFNPYKNNYSPSLNLANAVVDSINPTTLDINLYYHKPDASTAYFPVWDKFHYGNTRIYIPVELPSYCNTVNSFTVIDSSGAYDIAIHAVEHFEGKTILHIEVDIPNDMYSAITYFIKFRITYSPLGITLHEDNLQNIHIFPNPSNDNVTLQFINTDHAQFSVSIYDARGQIVKEMNAVTNSEVSIEGLKSGMYFYRLQNSDGVVGQGKFIIE